MIRGISKKIIEVNDTGSELFEKALLFVKSDNSLSDRELKNEADRIILSYMSENGNSYKMGYLRKKDKQKTKNITLAICTALLGVALIITAVCLL